MPEYEPSAALGSGGAPSASVAAVEPGDAARAGIRPGDVVLAVDGQPVRDIIDWWWLTDEPSFSVTVERGGAPLTIPVTRTPGESLGVSFAEMLFTPIRQCENACTFCFISGVPQGMRPGLSVRDDDFRLSFLTGNFVTLTNLEPADVRRIITQHLSPLHVSVHAVDPEVRESLICPTAGDDTLGILDELLAAGIEAHVQIVLVPGVNDAAVLEETLTYLSERDGILSVGCVPMGYTAHQRRWTSSFNAVSAAAVLLQLAPWQARMRTERDLGWVYAADEFYFLAGVAIPDAEAYDDFPQFENGIGMASAFRDEFRHHGGGNPGDVVLVTGELFAPFLREVLADAGWYGVRVLPVGNRLFGGNVSVTGLLGGADIVGAVRADMATGGPRPEPPRYFVPDVVVNSDGLLLDDVQAADLAVRSGADVRLVGSDAGSLIDALTERSD